MLALAGLCPLSVLGQSRLGDTGPGRTEITAYDAQIRLGLDGRLFVREDITVRGLESAAEWDGLFRTFTPDRPGQHMIPFSEMQVAYNGGVHRWWSPVLGPGRDVIGIRIHYPEALPPPGVHRFTLEYVTQPWVVRAADGDHLEWSVTGDGWAFPILSTTAEIRLPGRGNYDLCRWDSRERGRGSIRWRVSGTWLEDAQCTVSADRLEAEQSVDLSLTLTSGSVREPLRPPQLVEDLVWYLDWAPYMDGELILALVFSVFVLIWLRVRRSAPVGTLVSEYESPDGLSPAVVGYLRAGGYTDACLGAALVDLAVKGVIRIEVRDGRWHLRRTGLNEDAASPEERGVLRWIPRSDGGVALPDPEVVRRAARALRIFLDEELRPHFKRHRLWFAVGMLVSVVGFASLVWRVRATLSPDGLPLGLLYVMGSVVLIPMLLDLGRRWRTALALGTVRRFRPLALPTLALTLFTLLVGMMGLSLRQQIAGHLIVAALALVVLNVLFYRWLTTPSIGGRRLLDRVEGFRHFLMSTAADRLNRLAPPLTTLQEIDPDLPYAVALHVSVRWAEGFSDALHARPTVLRPATGAGRWQAPR